MFSGVFCSKLSVELLCIQTINFKQQCNLDINLISIIFMRPNHFVLGLPKKELLATPLPESLFSSLGSVLIARQNFSRMDPDHKMCCAFLLWQIKISDSLSRTWAWFHLGTTVWQTRVLSKSWMLLCLTISSVAISVLRQGRSWKSSI